MFEAGSTLSFVQALHPLPFVTDFLENCPSNRMALSYLINVSYLILQSCILPVWFRTFRRYCSCSSLVSVKCTMFTHFNCPVALKIVCNELHVLDFFAYRFSFHNLDQSEMAVPLWQSRSVMTTQHVPVNLTST